MKKRRRRRSPAARIRPFWMPLVFCAAVVLGALGVAATWPGFNPKHVAVTGNHRVGSGEILAHAAINPRVSIWLQNTRAIEARVATIPYIDRAAVHRIPPASIVIVVTERAPFATLRSGDDAAVVDRKMRVLTLDTPDEQLPELVIDPGANLVPGAFVGTHQALALRDAYDAVTERGIVPTQLSLDRFGGLVVTMRGGLRLLFGSESDMSGKVRLAQAILAQVVGHEPRVAAVDLRAPAAPVLVYR
jgi:cell division septal protein FtsQ